MENHLSPTYLAFFNIQYPLVNIQKAIENGVEIVDFPIKNKVDLSIVM